MPRLLFLVHAQHQTGEAEVKNILMQTTFNTGRQYTHEGQVITAAIADGWDVYFNDHSRCIWGKLNYSYPYNQADEARLQDFVLQEYDNMRYTGDTEAGKLQRG